MGIYLNNSHNNLIQENGINHTAYAIILENSNYNNISNNILNENDWFGIYIRIIAIFKYFCLNNFGQGGNIGFL